MQPRAHSDGSWPYSQSDLAPAAPRLATPCGLTWQRCVLLAALPDQPQPAEGIVARTAPRWAALPAETGRVERRRGWALAPGRRAADPRSVIFTPRRSLLKMRFHKSKMASHLGEYKTATCGSASRRFRDDLTHPGGVSGQRRAHQQLRAGT